MASFNASLNTEKSLGNPLIRTQSNTVSNQGQEGTCYAHTVARIFSRLIKVKFADLFKNVSTEECNIYYSKEDCDDNIFRCFENEPKCSGDLDRDGMPIENISALLYVYLYKEVRNRYGCNGAQVTNSLQLLIDLFKNQTRILRIDIVSTVLLNGDAAYNIEMSPKREYLYKLIDRLVNIIMVVKRKVATDEIILNRALPICTTRKCSDGPVDYYPEVFNAMNITGYYSGLALFGVTDERGSNLAHAVTISGFGFDAYNRSPQLIIKNSWGKKKNWSNVIKDNKVTIFALPKKVRLFVSYVIFKSDEPRIQAAVHNARKEAEAATKDKKATDDEYMKKADEDRKNADEDRKNADDRKTAQIALIPQWVGQLNSGTNAEKLTALQSLATLIEPLKTYEYIHTLSDSSGFEALINLANNGEPTAKENAKDMLFKMVDSSHTVDHSKEYYEIQKKIITEINRIDKGIILYIVNRLIDELGGLFGIDDSQEDDLNQIKRLGFAEEILRGHDKIEKLRIIANENRTLIRTAEWILPQIQDRDIAKNIELLRYLAESSDAYIKAAALGLLGDLAEKHENIVAIADLQEVVVRGLQCKEFIYGSCHDGRILGIARENAAKTLLNVVSLGNNADDEEYRPAYVIERMFQSRAIDELVIALNNGGPKLDEYILGALAAITTSKIASKVILRLKNAITKIFDKTSPNRKIEVQLNAIKVIHGLVKHEEYRFAIAAVGNFDDLTKLTASSNEEIKQIAAETLVLLEPYNNPERLKSQARTMADHLFIEMFDYDIPKAHDIMYNILSEKPYLVISKTTIRYIVGKVNKARDKAPAMQVLVDKMGSDDIAIGLLSSGVSAKMLIQLARDCARPPPNASSTPAASSNRVRVLVLAVTALTKASPIEHGVEDIFIEPSDIERLIDLAMTDQFANAGEIIDIRPIAITALKHFLVEDEYVGTYSPNTKQFIEFITTATSALVNKLASDATTDAKKLMAVNTLYNMVGPKSAAGPHPYNSKIPFAIANTKDCIPTLIRLLTSVNEEVKMAVVKLLFRLALANDKAFADAGAIPVLTDALRAGQHNFKSWAAGVLGVISVKDDNIRKLVNDAGAIPLLITLAGSPDQTGADYNTFANGALIELAQNADIANAIRTAGYTITAAGGKTRKHQTHNQNKTNKKNKPNKTNKKTLPSKKSVSRKNRNGSRR